MRSLGEARALGGVGSMLILLFAILLYVIDPLAGLILSIIGWIMILVAVQSLEDNLGGPMFNSLLVGAIFATIGTIDSTFVLGTFFQFIGIRSTLILATSFPGDLFIVGLVIAWASFITASIFLKRSYDSLATKSDIGTFHTTALLFVVGAVTTIILVGFLILFIGVIFQTVAYFSLPEGIPNEPVRAERVRSPSQFPAIERPHFLEEEKRIGGGT